MGFSKKIKKYFKEKNISQRKLSKIMNWSELSVSRAMRSDTLSITFIEKLIQYFPDIDLNDLLKENLPDNEVREPGETYKTEAKPMELVEEIEEKLVELKKVLAQKI